jgi:hypothetical protein
VLWRGVFAAGPRACRTGGPEHRTWPDGIAIEQRCGVNGVYRAEGHCGLARSV